MVAANLTSAPTTPLPTLSKPDRLRLTLYFATGQSVEGLALELNQIHFHHQRHLTDPTQKPHPLAPALQIENTALAPICSSSSALSTQSSALSETQSSALPPPPDSYDLASWTLSPEIAPHIAYRRAESLERRKFSALQELDTILATSESPIEKRRAATTMLRMLVRSSSPSLREGVGGREPEPQQRPRPSSTSGGGAAGRGIRGGGGSVSTPPTHAPTFERATPTALAPDTESPAEPSSPTSAPASLSHSATASPHLCPSVSSVASSISFPHLRPSASSAASSTSSAAVPTPLPLNTG